MLGIEKLREIRELTIPKPSGSISLNLIIDNQQVSVNIALGPEIGKKHLTLWIAFGGHERRKEQHCSLKQNNIKT
jgi:hypothetical protein